MGFMLNLKSLHGPRSPNMGTGWPDSLAFLTDAKTYSLSRRQFLAGATAMAAGLSPASRALGNTLLASEFVQERGKAIFRSGGVDRWVIDPRRFAGKPNLNVTRGKTESGEEWLRIQLSGARYPGTALPADFLAEVTPGLNGLQLSLAFPHLGWQSKVQLNNWLMGLTQATGTLDRRVRLGGPDPQTQVTLQPQADLTFYPDWHFVLEGRTVAELTTPQAVFQAEAATVVLLDETAPSLLKSPGNRRSLVTLYSGRHDWSAWPVPQSALGKPGCFLDGDKAPFDRASAEFGEGRTGTLRSAVLFDATAEGAQVYFHHAGNLTATDGSPLRLPVVQPRCALTVGPDGAEAAIIGRFPVEPVPARSGGVIFSLGAAASTPDFELLSRNGRVSRLTAQPAVKSLTAPLSGALVESMTVPAGTHLRLTLGAKATWADAAAPTADAPPPPPILSPTRTVTAIEQVDVIRPADLLRLTFRFQHVVLESGADGTARLRPDSTGQAAYMIVIFPPQHILERAFSPNVPPTGSTGPVSVHMSGSSRLVFEVPSGGIPYSLEADPTAPSGPTSLLDWAPLTMVTREIKTNPDASLTPVTAIEAPYRLILNPVTAQSPKWLTSNPQVTPGQNQVLRVPLWHTRLSGPSLQVRAIWTRDEDAGAAPLPTRDGKTPDDYWKSVPDAATRTDLVKLTTADGSNQPVGVKELMLSPLGAWLNASQSWDVSTISLKHWEHRMLMGRDQHGMTVKAGYLFPFGIPATLVEITDREFGDDGRAYVWYRSYVVLKETQVTFSPVGGNLLPEMPLQRVEVVNYDQPLLDDFGTGLYSQGKKMFIPKVDGKEYIFKFVGTDWTGQSIQFSSKMAFIDENLLTAPPASVVSSLATAYTSDPAWSTLKLSGQSVGYATEPPLPADSPPATSGTTRYDTSSLSLGVDLLSGQKPYFRPYLIKADIKSGIENLTDVPGATLVRYFDLYLQYGFDTVHNPGEVYLELVQETGSGIASMGVRSAGLVEAADKALKFTAEKSGGLISPNMSIAGISRKIGAAGGDLLKVAKGEFEPSIIDAAAKLVGIVPLQKLIGALNWVQEAVETYNDATELVPSVSIQRGYVRKKESKSGTTSSKSISATTGDTSGEETMKDLYHAMMIGINWTLPAKYFRSWPDWSAPKKPIFEKIETDDETKNTQLVVDATKVIKRKPVKKKEYNKLQPKYTLGFGMSASIQNFKVNIPDFFPPHPPLITLSFASIGVEKPLKAKRKGTTKVRNAKVTVKLTKVDYGGLLRWFNALASVMPFGLGDVAGGGGNPGDDPRPGGAPEEESAPAISKTISKPLPNLKLGIFNITNIHFVIGIKIPLLSGPLVISMGLNTPEDPFLIAVGIYGGGGMIGVSVTPTRFQSFSIALELGLVSLINFAVAKGSVSIMVGIYLHMSFNGSDDQPDKPASVLTLTGYVRGEGQVCVLGIVNLSVVFLLSLTYSTAGNMLWGQASLTVSVKMLFFRKKVSFTVQKVFHSDKNSSSISGAAEQIRQIPPAQQAQYLAEYCSAFY